jgi:hypothetical protein
MLTALQETHSLFLSTLTDLCSPSSMLPHPSAMVFDVYGANIILPRANEIAGPKVKTLMHITQGASSMYGFFASSAKSGISDYETAVERIYSHEELRQGRDKAQVVEAVSRGSSKSEGTSNIGESFLTEAIGYSRQKRDRQSQRDCNPRPRGQRTLRL